MDIPFNIPYTTGREIEYLEEAIAKGSFSSCGYFNQTSEEKLREITKTSEVLLTTSCTHALEMCAILLDISEGDEVIMSSFNFVSAANAFALRGAKIVFVDIDPGSMNINPDLIEAAITENTRAILVMHYAGVPCDMDRIKRISTKHSIPVVEDAAHCINSYYERQHLGTIGDLGALSFHATKNIHCGEGGALLINNEKYKERAYILRDKGTNRRIFMQGNVDKYSWVDVGSSYGLSELNAAFLTAQLENVDDVTIKRQIVANDYVEKLEVPAKMIEIGNGHIFFIKCIDEADRIKLMIYLNQKGINVTFHYVPLHSSSYGIKNSKFCGEDKFTTKESSRLLRLPIYPEFRNASLIWTAINNYYDRS